MISELPDSYRWSGGEDYATLYLRWGWVASVKAGLVEVRTRDGGRMTGRCGSIEQGKRHVERWVLAQFNGTYRRWQLSKAQPLRPPTEPGMAALRILRQSAPAPAVTPVAAAEDWLDSVESEVYRVEVPFERVLSLSRKATGAG